MSIWQTEPWQKMLLMSGQTQQYFFGDHAFVEKRQLSFGKYGLFIVGLEVPITQQLCGELQMLCKKENCLFVQIETLSYGETGQENEVVKFKKGYYKKFITPHTAVIDLQKSEEDILSLMKPKGRYNIRLAEKKEVQVEEVSKSITNIKQFYDLVQETTRRDKFSGNTLEYYEAFLNDIEGSKLLFAYEGYEVIAGGIFVFDPEVSIYYYGASTSNTKYRNLMAPYLLQWEAIKMAKESGSKIYDFLGVASPGEKGSSLSGVTDFKLKLTPDIREVSTSYIWINKKLLYNLLVLLKGIRKMF